MSPAAPPSATNPLAAHVEALNASGRRVEGPPLVAVRGAIAPAHDARSYKREGNWHHHHRGQFICIDSGTVHLRTHHGSWLLPPHRVGWIPPNEPHAVMSVGVSVSWNLFVTPQAAQGLPGRPSVMDVSALAQALIQRAATWTQADRLEPRQRRLVGVLLDELRSAPTDEMSLPLPSDRRLLRIASAIADNPGDTRKLEDWAEVAGMSPRSVNRLFQTELGMSFAHWRQQAMLVHALERLAGGDSVATVADALGYASPSSFIAMFRKFFGDSPSRYLARQAGGQGGAV